MVGYQQNDTMTPHQKLLAGCISGVATRFITQPLDVVKIRTQLQQKHALENKAKWFGTTRKILSEEGLTAFWHGHNLGQVHSVLSVSSQFYVYELATRFVTHLTVDERLKPVMMFFCGSLAGACSATLVIPLEVVRVRQMIVKEQYRGFIKGAKTVYNSGGIFAFYEGLSASILQMGPAVGISFSVFRVVQPWILKFFHDCDDGKCKHAPGNAHRPEYLVIASTIAGSVAGFISKTLTYPFDLAKRRLQIATHQPDTKYSPPSTSKNLMRCQKLSECLAQSYRTEGIYGLYRGWKSHFEDIKYKTPSTSKDLIKCRKLVQCLVDMYRAEGIDGLYRGCNVTGWKGTLTSVAAFTTYELTCYAIRESSAFQR